MEQVLILGSGPAGYTAAVYAARAGLKPALVLGNQPGGQLTTTTEIENYPGFPDGVDAFTLMESMRQQAERFGTRVLSGTAESAEFTPHARRIRLDSGDTLETQALIIATGASAKYLGLPSEQALRGHGVSACATCDGAFYKDVPVAVVGGGDTAMEEALFLTRFASRVHIIHRRDEFRASKIMADRTLHNEKIEVHWDSVVTEVHDPKQQKVTGVTLRNVKTNETSRLDVEGYFAAIGHKPNTDAFQGLLDMTEQGYLLTDGVRTPVEGVYAAGDVQDSIYRQAITAAGSGCMAAMEAERWLGSRTAKG